MKLVENEEEEKIRCELLWLNNRLNEYINNTFIYYEQVQQLIEYYTPSCKNPIPIKSIENIDVIIKN